MPGYRELLYHTRQEMYKCLVLQTFACSLQDRKLINSKDITEKFVNQE